MTPPPTDSPAPPAPVVEKPRTCPPFRPQRFARELFLDSAIRWTVFLSLGACIATTSFWSAESTLPGGMLILGVAAAWIGISVVSARVAQQLARVMELVGPEPAQAESLLATLIRRRPLQRTVRVLLYHRLATLRHRQQRLTEAAAICQALLDGRHGLARDVRAHLRLMLVESHLQHNDLWGAHEQLTLLHASRLSLLESLQRLALQTRYEIQSGHDRAALVNVGLKIQMSELLPPTQCGAIHLMLAGAAERESVARLAEWLRARAALLCTPGEIAQLAGSDWKPSVTELI